MFLLNQSLESIYSESMERRLESCIRISAISFLPTRGKSCCLMQKSVVHIKIRREKRISYWSKIQKIKICFVPYLKQLIRNYMHNRS